MDVSLEIKSANVPALLSALGGSRVTPGDEFALGDDATARYDGVRAVRSMDTATTVLFFLSLPVGIASNVLADWIIRLLHQKGADSHVESAVAEYEHVSESVDKDGKRTTSRVTRYEEIKMR